LTPACSSIVDGDEEIEARGDDENEIRETLMLSVSPLPLLLVASLPGGNLYFSAPIFQTKIESLSNH